MKAYQRGHQPDGSLHHFGDFNKSNILRLIFQQGKISRRQLSEQSGLSSPAVFRVVQTLVREGLVREAGISESRGGKKSKLLEFAGTDNLIIGIDLGTSSIHGVLSNLNAEIFAETSEPTPVNGDFVTVLMKTCQVIDSLLDWPGCRRDMILGIGMAVEGLINRPLNIIDYTPAFNWTNIDIRGPLMRHTRLPVILDNTARTMALGELWYGVGRQHKHFICVHAGYGIGAGIILEGNPLYGATGKAGELGHVILDSRSQIYCRYGHAGCLEALSSAKAIVDAARLRLQSGADSLLMSLCQEDFSKITLEMVVDAAKNGDTVAGIVFDQAAEYLGIGVAGLINLFNPEAVLIGGDLALSGDMLFDRLKKTVLARALRIMAHDIPILPASFGDRAVVIGAVSLILAEVLNFHPLECPCREPMETGRETEHEKRNGYVL